MHNRLVIFEVLPLAKTRLLDKVIRFSEAVELLLCTSHTNLGLDQQAVDDNCTQSCIW